MSMTRILGVGHEQLKSRVQLQVADLQQQFQLAYNKNLGLIFSRHSSETNQKWHRHSAPSNKTVDDRIASLKLINK